MKPDILDSGFMTAWWSETALYQKRVKIIQQHSPHTQQLVCSEPSFLMLIQEAGATLYERQLIMFWVEGAGRVKK
jgi:hypothetical protein